MRVVKTDYNRAGMKFGTIRKAVYNNKYIFHPTMSAASKFQLSASSNSLLALKIKNSALIKPGEFFEINDRFL